MRVRSFFGKLRKKIIRILVGRELYTKIFSGGNVIICTDNDFKNEILGALYEQKRTMESNYTEIQRTIEEMPMVADINTKAFSKYRNINKDKDIVVMGAGPTLNFYEPIKNAVHIGVNETIHYEKIIMDYYFTADFKGFTEKLVNAIKNYPKSCKKFFSVLNIPTIPLKYYDTLNAEAYCARHAHYGNSIFHYDISKTYLVTYGGIIFAPMQFALWTHPKRIYLAGCDCSLSGSIIYHFTGLALDGKGNPSFHNRLLKSWNNLKEFQQRYYPDVEIISINPVGLKGVFKDIYTESYIESLSTPF